MPKVVHPVVFEASHVASSYIVPFTGNYVIAAAGAQGGSGAESGGKGAFAQGTFYLRKGELLYLIVGCQGGPSRAAPFSPDYPPCGGGGGGGTFVWKGTPAGTIPAWPLLVAGGGGGGGTEPGGDGRTGIETGIHAEAGLSHVNGHGGVANPCCLFGGGGGAGWLSPGANGPGPIYCRGGTHWTGGDGVSYGEMAGGDGGFGGGGGGGFLGYATGGGGGFGGGSGGGQMESELHRVRRSSGGSSYNSGVDQTNHAGCRAGDGRVTVTAIAESIVLKATSHSSTGSQVSAPGMRTGTHG